MSSQKPNIVKQNTNTIAKAKILIDKVIKAVLSAEDPASVDRSSTLSKYDNIQYKKFNLEKFFPFKMIAAGAVFTQSDRHRWAAYCLGGGEGTEPELTYSKTERSDASNHDIEHTAVEKKDEDDDDEDEDEDIDGDENAEVDEDEDEDEDYDINNNEINAAVEDAARRQVLGNNLNDMDGLHLGTEPVQIEGGHRRNRRRAVANIARSRAPSPNIVTNHNYYGSGPVHGNVHGHHGNVGHHGNHHGHNVHGHDQLNNYSTNVASPPEWTAMACSFNDSIQPRLTSQEKRRWAGIKRRCPFPTNPQDSRSQSRSSKKARRSGH